MDETSTSIIEKITVRHLSPTPIPSGKLCSVFYDCVRLSPNDLARLAAEATGALRDDAFDVAVGIAYNGIFFAAAVAGGRGAAILQRDGEVCGPSLSGKKIIIVDDVVHTGSNLRTAEAQLKSHNAMVVGYACIVDRSGGKIGSNEIPLWSAFQTQME